MNSQKINCPNCGHLYAVEEVLEKQLMSKLKKGFDEERNQLQQVLGLSRITRVLCDNFSINDLSSAVKLTKGKLRLEASGNIDESNIVEVANTGVDCISIGSITKNIQAVDLSLRFS